MNALPDGVAAKVQALRTRSFERVLCPEDLEAASIDFTHFADEIDAFEDDHYSVRAKGVVLGRQDSHYVVFTTRCAADFEWPNHDIRWREKHGHEDGKPEFRNEGLIVHFANKRDSDEWFAYGTTDLDSARQYPEDRPTGSKESRENAEEDIEVIEEIEEGPTYDVERHRRWKLLREAREAGDLVTIDRFKNEKGKDSDVALVYIPIHRDSTIRLNHLGMNRPKDAVREALAKQGVLFGIEFEFSCQHCQRMVQGHRSREKEAFLLGFGVGLVTGRFIVPFLERLLQVDDRLARGSGLTQRLQPETRLAPEGLKAQILQRDGFTCSYAQLGMCDPTTCWACIAKNLHVDHVVPFSRGGKTVPDNLVTSCAACNLSKGATMLAKWLAAKER